MSQRVLVRGQLSWWTVVLRFGGPLVLLAGVFGYLAEPALGITLLAIGFLLTLTVEVWLFNIRRQRRWVEDKGSGFQIEDRAGLRTIADEQVFSLAYYKRRVHSEGILKGVWRHFLVWVEGESVPFEMQNWIPDEQTDPLSGLIARLLEKSLDRAALTLERGGQISGEGWTLDNSFLLLPGKPLPEQVRFDELSAVEVFDEHLCIWRRGIDEALAKLPQRSRDVHLLQLLLTERLPAEGASTPIEADGLGRILFERRPSRVITTLVWSSFLPTFLFGLFCALIPDSRPAGIGILLASPLLLLIAWHCQISVFRCHERGVFKKFLGGTRQLRYTDMATFTYSAVRHYHNGAYVGTNLSLHFEPLPGTPAKPIAYSITVKAADESLDGLRDHISRVLAARMGEELSQGRPAVWTANLTYTPEGIVYRPSTFLGGRKEPLLLPYEQFGGYDFNQGKFRLWQKGNPKPVTTEASSQKNFYPGYVLLLRKFYNAEK